MDIFSWITSRKWTKAEPLADMLVRRRSAVRFPAGGHELLPDTVVVGMLKNLESLGFTLDAEAVKRLQQVPEGDLLPLYSALIASLRQLVGDHVLYQPMYPNFPKQVAEADEAELYINAYIHYFGDWCGVRIMPDYDVEKRPKLKEFAKLKVLRVAGDDEPSLLLKQLLGAKSSLSATDKADITVLMRHVGDKFADALPDEIPHKENMAYALSEGFKAGLIDDTVVGRYLKTATDVLRFVVALSDGDVSLAMPSKYAKLSKPNRRNILLWLEKCGNITEDMLRYPEQWKRLGERLHPGQYAKRYSKAAAAFDVIRNDKPYETFNSRVEQALQSGDTKAALKLLSDRPGELARRLDFLLRAGDDAAAVLRAFKKVADQVSSPVLWQMYAHFASRNEPSELRVFFPKGNVGRARAVENVLPNMPAHTLKQVNQLLHDTLKSRYSKLKPLGKVYVAPELKDYTTPMMLRSASRSLHALGRGSSFALDDGETVRFFIWWTDGSERTDIDLSAVGLDTDSKFKMQIAYYNLKDIGGYHSGDITSAPRGASEFIDVHIPTALDRGVRYIAGIVNSYTQQPFYELPECFVGFMVRKEPRSGEIYEPRTVQRKVDLTADTRMTIPFILDLQERKVLWTDLDVKNFPSTNNNVYNNMSTITLLNKAMFSLRKPKLYDLFVLHAEARGKLVNDKADADTVFALEEGITPYQTEKIISEFL